MVGEVTSVTFGTDTLLRFAGKHRTDLHRLYRRFLYTVSDSLCDFLAGMNYDLLRIVGINYIMNGYASENTLAERCDYFLVVLDFCADKTTERSAILFVDDHVMRHVYETAGEITGIGCLKSRIRKTLARTVGRDKVLKHRQTLLEVRQNRVLDNLTTLGTGFLRLSHKATHT